MVNLRVHTMYFSTEVINYLMWQWTCHDKNAKGHPIEMLTFWQKTLVSLTFNTNPLTFMLGSQIVPSSSLGQVNFPSLENNFYRLLAQWATVQSTNYLLTKSLAEMSKKWPQPNEMWQLFPQRTSLNSIFKPSIHD